MGIRAPKVRTHIFIEALPFLGIVNQGRPPFISRLAKKDENNCLTVRQQRHVPISDLGTIEI